tara:strand:- start:809 stop:1840 length:1032 start_codon:yes stop_codon:yes gene_type:complete
MLRDVHPSDVSIEPFKTFKKFTFNNNDSGSGVFALRATSGSFRAFDTGSAASQSIGQFNQVSYSIKLPKSTWYSGGTFYDIVTHHSLKQLYYDRYDYNPYQTHGSSNLNKHQRVLHNNASLISVPQQFFGEKIKPKSVKVLDDSKDFTLDIRDDGQGNLYDYAFSSSYSDFRSSGSFGTIQPANSSSGVIGNVFYQHGLIVMTSTGSRYLNAFLGSGNDGFSVTHRATHTIYQHEYTVTSKAGMHNTTKNISATLGRSGSFAIGEGVNPRKVFPMPGDASVTKSFYEATQFLQNEFTSSNFSPYITTIGLYNDFGDCLAIARTSKPIRNDDEMDMSFVVRFDV